MNVHRDFTTDERRMLIAHIIAHQITALALRGVIKPNASPSAPLTRPRLQVSRLYAHNPTEGSPALWERYARLQEQAPVLLSPVSI